jgi:selenocysteine lyase/cysteine desulfurase
MSNHMKESGFQRSFLLTRRQVVQGLSVLPFAPIAAAASIPADLGVEPPIPERRGRVSLPDKDNFSFEGTYINAAYTHPIGKRTQLATERYIRSRMTESDRNWPRQNSRDEAVALFAQLINAPATAVAVVPSTLEGENLIAASMGLGAGAGVVTDPFHYDASLVMYGELNKKGMPLTVLTPTENRIDYSKLEAAITHETRLVAVSLVSSETGYTHDLKTVCEIAHRKGAWVYADIIQGVGAIPIDVQASGVDFCCAGTYKWLMGEFGTAFLYVRPDRLKDLKRVQLGWRAMSSHTSHFLPFDPAGPVIGDWTLGTDTASIFEVSTLNWSALATVAGSLNYINDIGVEAIRRHADPMLRRLQEELPKHGFARLTPPEFQGPHVVFSFEDAGARFRDALKQAKIYVSVYKNKIRISPSVYNDMGDIDRLLKILSA